MLMLASISASSSIAFLAISSSSARSFSAAFFAARALPFFFKSSFLALSAAAFSFNARSSSSSKLFEGLFNPSLASRASSSTSHSSSLSSQLSVMLSKCFELVVELTKEGLWYGLLVDDFRQAVETKDNSRTVLYLSTSVALLGGGNGRNVAPNERREERMFVATNGPFVRRQRLVCSSHENWFSARIFCSQVEKCGCCEVLATMKV